MNETSDFWTELPAQLALEQWNITNILSVNNTRMGLRYQLQKYAGSVRRRCHVKLCDKQ
jgi:hypothetical protein